MFGRPILLRQYFGKIAHLQEELVTGLVPQRFVCERLALQFSVQLNLVSGIGKLFEIPFVEFKMKIVGYRVPDHAREEVPALRLKSLAQACARHCPVVVLAVVGEQFERTADERVQLVQEKIGHDTLSSLVILKQGCEVFERKPFIAHAHLYTGIENVLKTVVTVTDGGVFASGESYHAQLLAQAAQN
ncbi:MAG: hypothetical protein K2Y27_35240, partial [Xanthobacteraceae bacterium]|nr:hypothetical protein [Xanthobacteraceae bacterium]